MLPQLSYLLGNDKSAEKISICIKQTGGHGNGWYQIKINHLQSMKDNMLSLSTKNYLSN